MVWHYLFEIIVKDAWRTHISIGTSFFTTFVMIIHFRYLIFKLLKFWAALTDVHLANYLKCYHITSSIDICIEVNKRRCHEFFNTKHRITFENITLGSYDTASFILCILISILQESFLTWKILHGVMVKKVLEIWY